MKETSVFQTGQGAESLPEARAEVRKVMATPERPFGQLVVSGKEHRAGCVRSWAGPGVQHPGTPASRA